MKVLLISANSERSIMPVPPVGLLCVAQAARAAGHETAVIDLMAEEDPAARLNHAVERFDPGVIGLSVRNIDDQSMRSPRFLLDEAREVTRICRSLTGAPIVVGGPGYSMFPQEALDYLGADAGIPGDGEDAFTRLLHRLEQGEPLSDIPRLVRPDAPPPGEPFRPRDLDRLPLPEPDLLDRGAYHPDKLWVPVQSRRGCPLGCSYCSTATIEGRVVRKRSPGEVVRWMERWVAAGFHRFHFVDNTFNLPPSYAEALCDRISAAGLNVRWLGILYPARLTGRLVRKMARAGCRQVSLGFESGSPRMLRALNKHFSPEEVERAARMLSDHGIRQMGFLMLGGPGETRASVEESVAFADRLGLDLLKITVGIRIYPDTPLAELAVREGVIGAGESLLRPRFYLEKGLEGRLEEQVDAWVAEREQWQR
ncbi:MAG: radical SAM protein [Deltaproteobacteria bacterium]|nr:radical SAM protein [Deltaproteobacteria bacterium]